MVVMRSRLIISVYTFSDLRLQMKFIRVV